MKSASTPSLMSTITVLAVALSRAPRSKSQVMNMTIAKAGKLTRIGMPNTCGAVVSKPLTSGF